jgi:signal transduction histidine kinase/AmiR/NasT family two-component response regulator
MAPTKLSKQAAVNAVSLDALPIPLAVVDDAHCIASANAAFAKLLGRRPASLTGKPLGAQLIAAGAGVARFADGTTFELTGPDGDRWLRLSLAPFGEHILASLIDVTAERGALETGARVYAALDRLMHDAEVGAWSYDPDHDRYQFATSLSLGHEPAPYVPTETLRLLQHPDDAPRDAEIRERITTQGGAAEAEMRYRDADGGWRHLRVHYLAGRKLPSGLYEMHGLSQNITPQAMARDEADANASRLKLALTGAQAGVYEYDYDKQSFWVSPEFRVIAGWGDDPFYGHPFDLYHPDDRDLATDLRRRAQRQVGADPVDVRLLRTGGERWVRLYLEVERNDQGRPIRGVGLMLDVDTEKRQELALDEARRIAEAATAAKSDFLASVSHEIRTPMNGIVGVLNLLRRENLSDEARNLLGEAIGCSEMLAGLINDVLDFSKIEAGKLELSPTVTAPATIAEGVVNLIRPQAEDKGLYVRLASEPSIGFAELDSVRLRQCLFNVIGNAVKFTQAGGVEVRLSTIGEGETRRLRCEIEDTGIGIPESARSRLFDRFEQADSTTTRRFGGTGLGLAISRSLARMMGGELDFTSRPGQGSTFWLEIAAPVRLAPAATAADDLTATPLEGLRILVVDDNRINCLVAVKSLEALGAEAQSVESGQAGIEAVSQSAFDLVLMDVNMPEMDGLEATRRIRALDLPCAQIPIIALTADVMSHQRLTYQKAGMDGVVPKPFSPAQLLSEIAAVASRSEEEVAEVRAASA